MNKKSILKESGGAVLLIFLALTLLMTMFLSYSYFTTNQKIAKEELQAASDAAALAAVKEFCPSDQCYYNALRKAAQTLLTYSARNSLGKKIPLLTHAQFNPEDLHNFNDNQIGNDKIMVTIERGRWVTKDWVTKDTEDKEYFESFEIDDNDLSWEDKFPAVPKVLAANAVRVTIAVRSPFELFSRKAEGNIKSSAIAVWGEGKISSCAAPFAIPVCALLDAGGNYDPQANCSAERFFTRSDRYCPDGDVSGNCGIRPGFIYNLEQAVPPSSLGVNSEQALLTECKVDSAHPRPLNPMPWLLPSNLLPLPEQVNNVEEIPLGWCNPSFKKVQDHFAVVGVPDTDEMANANIADEIEKGCLEMKIGQPFRIMHEGFSGITNEDAIEIEENLGAKVSTPTDPERLVQLSPLPFPKNFGSTTEDALQAAGGYFLTSDKDVARGLIEEGGEDPDYGNGTPPFPTSTPNGVASPDPITEDEIQNDDTNDDDDDTTQPVAQSPNLLERSAQVAGLCRSFRAKLQCATTDSANFNPEINIETLKVSSVHFPEKLSYIDMPPTPPNEHPCNLNKQENYQAYLNRLKELAINCTQNYATELCARLPGLEVIYEKLNQVNNSPAVYANIKATSKSYPSPGSENSENQKFWQVKVPVIANFASDAQGCQVDPAIIADEEKANYQIIGFVDVQIFDFDITGDEIRTDYGQPIGQTNGPFPSGKMVGEVPENGPKNWYFSINGEDPSACNLIRGRVACETGFISSASDSYDPALTRPALRE